MAKIFIPASEREREQQITIASSEQRLPIEAYVQVYPRVSTPEQKKNVSAEMQQDKRFALRCGWTNERIIMDTRDLGLSGRLRMEDRPAFSDMIAGIRRREDKDHHCRQRFKAFPRPLGKRIRQVYGNLLHLWCESRYPQQDANRHRVHLRLFQALRH